MKLIILALILIGLTGCASFNFNLKPCPFYTGDPNTIPYDAYYFNCH